MVLKWVQKLVLEQVPVLGLVQGQDMGLGLQFLAGI
jgi:hypothetical protein